MTQSKSQQPISGVNCVVTACEYHSDDNKCHAGNITVGNHSATAKAETDCETFVKKNCCN